MHAHTRTLQANLTCLSRAQGEIKENPDDNFDPLDSADLVPKKSRFLGTLKFNMFKLFAFQVFAFNLFAQGKHSYSYTRALTRALVHAPARPQTW